MSGFFLSPQAEDDVWSIWRYLAVESGASVADEVQAHLFEAFESLTRMPGRSDLTSRNVFFFTVYQYMIVYRKDTPLELVAVIHGKRDVERILGTRSL